MQVYCEAEHGACEWNGRSRRRRSDFPRSPLQPQLRVPDRSERNAGAQASADAVNYASQSSESASADSREDKKIWNDVMLAFARAGASEPLLRQGGEFLVDDDDYHDGDDFSRAPAGLGPK